MISVLYIPNPWYFILALGFIHWTTGSLWTIPLWFKLSSPRPPPPILIGFLVHQLSCDDLNKTPLTCVYNSLVKRLLVASILITPVTHYKMGQTEKLITSQKSISWKLPVHKTEQRLSVMVWQLSFDISLPLDSPSASYPVSLWDQNNIDGRMNNIVQWFFNEGPGWNGYDVKCLEWLVCQNLSSSVENVQFVRTFHWWFCSN